MRNASILFLCLWTSLFAVGSEVDWVAFTASDDGSVRALRTEAFREGYRVVEEKFTLVTYDAAGNVVRTVNLPKGPTKAPFQYRNIATDGANTYLLANSAERAVAVPELPLGEALYGHNELLVLRVDDVGRVSQHSVHTSPRFHDEGVTLTVDEKGQVWVVSSHAAPSTSSEFFRLTPQLQLDATFADAGRLAIPLVEPSCAMQFVSGLTSANGFLFFAVDSRTATSALETLPHIHWYSAVIDDAHNIHWMNESKPFESMRRAKNSDHLGSAFVGRDGRSLFLVRGKKSSVEVFRHASAGAAGTASAKLGHALGTSPVFASRGAVALTESGTLVVAGRKGATSNVAVSFLRGPELQVETRLIKKALLP